MHLRNAGNEYIFWNDNALVGRPIDIMVPPTRHSAFFSMLNATAADSELFMNDVQYFIDHERPKNRKARVFDWTDYGTLDEVHEWLAELADKYDEVELVEAGHSYEGRKIVGVKVSYSPENENRGIFLEGGIHAREWISSAVVTYTLNEILTSQDPEVRALAESHDWYVFPNINPDGYVYTFEEDRMWRKTRTPYNGCYGADPNRNWGWKWNTAGASSYPCSETYAGPSEFSEVEMRTLSEYISTIGHKLEAYIAHHSYSQYLLIPFGLYNEYPDNYDELYSVGVTAMKALKSVHGTEFIPGQIVDLLYEASGGSMDWVKGVFDTRITYTYELRDTGRYGFVLPANQIIPSGEENMKALITMFQEFEKRK